jgi:hypothetical protein
MVRRSGGGFSDVYYQHGKGGVIMPWLMCAGAMFVAWDIIDRRKLLGWHVVGLTAAGVYFLPEIIKLARWA